MKAIVFGATGLTGRHTVAVLRNAGDETVAHVRPDSPRLAGWQARFEAQGATVAATAWQPEAIAALLLSTAPDVVFALLGTTQARAKKEGIGGGSAAYDSVDVRLTEMLIDGASALSKRPRFVYLSSSGAGSGSGAYLAARKRVEDRLIRSGLPYTIARPSFIVGDRDDPRLSEKLGAPIADGALALVGLFGARATRDRYRSITGEQLARGLVRLARDPAWAQRIAEREDL